MTKQPIRDKAEQGRDPRAHVVVKVEVVEVFEDHLTVSPHGDNTIGRCVDGMIESLGLQAGKRLGKLTIDLSEFSQAFITDRVNPL